MAKVGLVKSQLNPLFSQISSLVITEELLISLPDADRVKITPMGRHLSASLLRE